MNNLISVGFTIKIPSKDFSVNNATVQGESSNGSKNVVSVA